MAMPTRLGQLLRFRMRTLLILVAILCVVCAVVGRRVGQALRQQQAVELLTNAGMYVYIDETTVPSWFESLLIDCFGEAAAYSPVEVQFDSDFLHNPEITVAQAFAALPQLADLKSLAVYNCTIDPPALAMICQCPAIEHLILSDVSLEANLSGLKKLSRLRKLDLGSLKTNDSTHLAGIGEVKQLETLEYDAAPLTTDDLLALRNLSSLTLLSFHHTSIGAIPPECEPMLRNLESLYISDTPLEPRGLEALLACQRLRELWISNDDQPPRDIDLAADTISQLLTLESLVLDAQTFSTESLLKISRLPRLKTLYLDIPQQPTTSYPIDLGPLARLISLEFLDIKNILIDDQQIETIAQLHNLTYLRCNNLALTPAGIKRLASLPNVTSLSIDGWALKASDLDTLATMPKLDSLYVGPFQVTDQELAVFRAKYPHIALETR